MKQSLLALLLAGILLITGCGAVSTVETTEAAKVTTHCVWYIVDGNVLATRTVKTGEGAPYLAPAPKENLIFSGWFTDEACTKPYDFTGRIYFDLYLYAGYTVDAASLTNQITTGIIRSVVQIKVTSYKKDWLGIKYDKSSSTGSGVIFAFSDSRDRAYLLTNCHVAVVPSGKDGADYTVVDYLGREYTGNLYKNVNGGSAISAAYDLACLWFSNPDEKLQRIDYASGDPAVGSHVISLGYPKGQSNSITFGKVSDYRTISLKNCEAYESNVTFPVAGHSAVINGGSSGGPLLDADLNLVGINYAATVEEGADFHRGYAIPLTKVWEFLNTYVYVNQNGATKPVN